MMVVTTIDGHDVDVVDDEDQDDDGEELCS